MNIQIDRHGQAASPRPTAAHGETPAHPATAIPPPSAIAGTDEDRGRSLRQELALVEPEATGDFHGQHRMVEEAQAVAAALSGMEQAALGFIRPSAVPPALPGGGIDDNA